MPFVNIKTLGGALSDAQKDELDKKITAHRPNDNGRTWPWMAAARKRSEQDAGLQSTGRHRRQKSSIQQIQAFGTPMSCGIYKSGSASGLKLMPSLRVFTYS